MDDKWMDRLMHGWMDDDMMIIIIIIIIIIFINLLIY